MKPRLKLSAAVLCGLVGLTAVLTACSSDPEASHGVIQSKEYDEATSGYFSFIPQFGANGQITGQIPIWNPGDPECYYIKFKDETGLKGDACVTREQFDRLKVGDQYLP